MRFRAFEVVLLDEHEHIRGVKLSLEPSFQRSDRRARSTTLKMQQPQGGGMKTGRR